MTVLNLEVEASADDAFEDTGTTAVFLTTQLPWFGKFVFSAHNGLRFFNGVSGLSGATINAGTQLTFRSRATDSGSFVGDWYAEDAAAPPTFVAVNGDVSGRTRTPVTCEGDGGDFGNWSLNTNETFAGPGVGIKGIIQHLADNYDPSAIVLLWIYSSGSGERRWEAFDDVGSLAPKLDIDYTAGAPEVTGSAVISGVGTMVAVGTVIALASAVITGIGTMAVVATLGVTQLGAAVMSGIGTLTAVPDLTLGGVAVIEGVGDLVAVGERGVEAAAVLSGVGTMTVIGEIATQLEGRAAIAGVGSMTVAGERIVTGQAALAGVGTLTPVGVITAVGAAALAGVGTLAVIGETGAILFTVFGIEREIDPADFPIGAVFVFEVHLAAPLGGIARARLFNITDAVEVTDSQVKTESVDADRLTSAVTLPAGSKRYRTEYGGS